MLLTRRTVLAGATLLAARSALAEEQLRIVVPFGAGSGTDNTMRVFSEAFRVATGRTAMVDNKPGGGTTIGTLEVSRAKPDGNTVLYTTGGHTTNAVLMRKLPYDPVEGFTPITLLTRSQGFGLMVSGESRFKTMDQYLAAARAEPGKITYGSSGIGNTTHVVGELFCRSAKVQLIHVPYKSTPINDAMAGTIDSFFVSPSLIMQYLQAGKLRMLGISSAKRMPQQPDVPTFGEYGIEADIPGWSGFWGPPKLPAATVDQLHKNILKAAHEKSFETFTRDNGAEIVGLPSAEFAAYVASEIERYKKVLPPLGIQID
ncbi:MAG: tripartite tricarboxylate transporter substrate binding protein [Reyranella sp.]|uniref:Bug family tripartite tricarboxylate transporter substrate binding protein n=1 Tax=Reyranella sp. TaxID=1929291 RepID=UPI001AD36941|nr:tripartite tricarboxylate transporter substrate binding protein [Reyranella sp.]MBN9088451.1 tripartite tricarboxylate transporter substrate binding protein [Reyranella sp.]